MMISDGLGCGPEQWHAWRDQGLGASDAGAICGLSPWASALSIWLRKTGRYAHTTEQETEWQRWGKRLETVMAEEFSARRGLAVAWRGSWHERSTARWQRATLDGLVFESGQDDIRLALGVLELKNTSWRSPLSWANQEVPALYQVQVQHQLMVTDLEAAWLAVLHDGNRFALHEIERDDEAIAVLEEIEADFWACVTEDRPPPADRSRHTEAAVREAFGEAREGAVVVLDAGLQEHVRAYARLQRQRHEIEAQMAEHRTNLMVALGDGEVGTDQSGQELVSWRSHQGSSLDVEALRQSHPALAEEHTRRTSVRRFLVKQQEEPPMTVSAS